MNEQGPSKEALAERARIIERLEGTLKNIRRGSPTGDFPPYRAGIERAISIIKAMEEQP